MPSPSISLNGIVQNIVPEAKSDDALRKELVELAQDVLNSHIGQNNGSDISELADVIKRNLLHQTPSGSTSLQFTTLLSRLLEQPVLNRKHATLLFLHSLSSSKGGRPQATFLPSLTGGMPSRPITSLSTGSELLPQPLKHNNKSKAQLLQEYRDRMGTYHYLRLLDRSKFATGIRHLPESLLLRDTLYILQGISGKYVKLFVSGTADQDSKLEFVDDPNAVISGPNKTLIHRLAELGHLYSRIDVFVRAREGKPGVGMIEQSLCHYLQTQLTDYYRLIAVLESQLSVALKNAQEDVAGRSGDIANKKDVKDGETGLTLKRLEVWIEEWRLRLRMMSVCVEGCRSAHGGALVNLIHGYTQTGDPFVRDFTDKTLEQVSKPFFATLHRWLFLGELHDPFSEFFVALDSELAHLQYVHPSTISGATGTLTGDEGFGITDGDDIQEEKEGGLRLWQGKYQFRKEMLPTFVGESFGRKIFSTGKSLNFIRYSCHDSDWVATREKLSSTGALQYSDISGLERSVDSAYSVASQRLLDIFFNKFKLLEHFKALKHYLMLGYGDFADQLMESLSPNLSRPANTLYRHNLTATLEAAIQSSNAQNDPPDILRRLDARMLEYSHGEIGWDVFTLEYKVDAPIDTVLDPDSMSKYLRIFSHLWKMKRVEGALSAGWMRVAGGARTFLRVPDLNYEWHKIRIVMAEMIHFIRQLQAFCQLEVIECQWKSLLDFIGKKEGDLDALVDAHRNYLDRIVKKLLLLSPKAGREEVILHQVNELLQTILQFRDAMDNFYNFTLAEAARRDLGHDDPRGIYTGGLYNHGRPSEALQRILSTISEYGSAFSERAQTIVHSLQGHPDLDCRFLSIRLSFSEFYKTKKEITAAKIS